jgi:peptidoglycan/xylan/chitin deacetylase (PgdA/CDA1 family)
MIKIFIPNNNLKERQYIIKLLLKDFLGINYRIYVEEIDNYIIQLSNNRQLIVNDDFFGRFNQPLEYLDIRNIPKDIKIACNTLFPEDFLPIIYGDDIIKLKNEAIYCGIDLFASSFFMLTRWEEYVIKKRDSHGRFCIKDSLAYKFSFYKRPIVNEYIEILWIFLFKLDDNLRRKKQKYKMILTHDIDYHLKYKNIFFLFKVLVGDIFKRKNIFLAIDNFVIFCKVKLCLDRDPFDSFDYLMDISEQYNMKTYFFFMAKGNTNYDNYYSLKDDFIQKLSRNIQKRQHFIGIHSSYDAYCSSAQFTKEKNEIKQQLGIETTYGRSHYLKFEIPITWQIWDDNNMKWDSTLGYTRDVGFRAGICWTYNVFNILTRTELKLQEKPLIVMDIALFNDKNNNTSEIMIKEIFNLLDKVKKYNGEFVLLWHNTSINANKWKKFKIVLEEVLKKGSQ